MNYNDPLVSVIMGIRYQNEDLATLKRSVFSILGQTYTNFELLICQNNSTLSSHQWLEEISSKDNRVRIIDGNGVDTQTKKLNRCLKEAAGTLIARMDDDDYSYPDRLERQVRFLDQHIGFNFVGCWVKEIDGPKELIRKLPLSPGIHDFRKTLPFVHPALLFRREALYAVDGYSESITQEGCDDYDLLLRMYSRGYYGANLQEVLLNYSVLSSQLNHRPYRFFINEFFTRVVRFREPNLLPRWWLWAIKPLIVGLIPRRLLYYLKH